MPTVEVLEDGAAVFHGKVLLFVDSNLLTRNYISMSICSLYDFSVSKFNSFIADKLNFYLYFLIIDLIIIELVDDALFVTKTGRGVQIKLSPPLE